MPYAAPTIDAFLKHLILSALDRWNIHFFVDGDGELGLYLNTECRVL